MPQPVSFSLLQNYPNPFNPSTTFEYELPAESKVTLRVHNLLGQVVETVVDGVQGSGDKQIEWNAGDLASGVYIYRLEASSVSGPIRTFSQVKRMLLVK